MIQYLCKQNKTKQTKEDLQMETKTTKSVTITEQEFISIFADVTTDVSNGVFETAKELGKEHNPMIDILLILHDASVCSRVCHKLFGEDENNKEE